MKKQVIHSFLLALPCVVALPIKESQLLFAQLGVENLDAHLPEGAVTCPVRRLISDEVLRTEFLLNLRECGIERRLVLRKESPPTSLFRYLSKSIVVDLVLFRIADPDGIVWETFLTSGEATVYGESPPLTAVPSPSSRYRSRPSCRLEQKCAHPARRGRR